MTVARNDITCLPNHEPRAWHSLPLEPTEEKGACFVTSDGFHARVVDTRVSNFVPALSSDGALRVAYNGSDQGGTSTIRRSTLDAGAWVSEVIALPPLEDLGDNAYRPGAYVEGADGTPHILLTLYGVQYATIRDNAWTWDIIEPALQFVRGSLALAADGTPRIAYILIGVDNPLMLGAPTQDGWATEMLASWDVVPESVQLDITADGTAHVLVELENGELRYVVSRNGKVDELLLPWASVDAVAHGADLRVAAARAVSNGEVVSGTFAGSSVDGEAVWEQPPSIYRRAAPPPKLAIGANGTTFVTHNTPEGRVLTTMRGADVRTELVTTDRSPAELIVDAAGEPHIFVSSWWTLLHISRGTCR